MIVGIVGASGDRFSEQTQVWARRRILEIFHRDNPMIIVAGPAVKGGIEDWAIEEAGKVGIPGRAVPFEGTEWTLVKRRQTQLVDQCDKLVCIVARRSPQRGIQYKHAPSFCTHCAKTDKGLDHNHVQSTGCWALQYARMKSKQTQLIIVGV